VHLDEERMGNKEGVDRPGGGMSDLGDKKKKTMTRGRERTPIRNDFAREKKDEKGLKCTPTRTRGKCKTKQAMWVEYEGRSTEGG